MKWKPISTAPKNRRIALWVRSEIVGGAFMLWPCTWIDGEWHWITKLPDGRFGPDPIGQDIKPTHWMEPRAPGAN